MARPPYQDDPPFEPAYNDGFSPTPRLASLLGEVYSKTGPLLLTRRELMECFGCRHLGAKNAREIQHHLSERGIQLRPRLEDTGIDDIVRLTCRREQLDPQRVAELLNREIALLVVGRMRLPLGHLLLLLGYARKSPAAVTAVEEACRVGELRISPAPRDAVATALVQIWSAHPSPIADDIELPAPPDFPLLSRLEAEAAAERMLQN